MFDSHFEVFLADTEESKKIHYKIRYQVYCEEMGFENKEDFPDEMEFDDDDVRATHFLVRNKITNKWVGAMRLINKGNELLPIEQSCNINEKINTNFFETVEMSRLCLIKDVRRGKDLDPPHGVMDDSNSIQDTAKVKSISNQNKLNRLIFWGMIYAASEFCYKNNIQFCYFLTTLILAKLMSRGGINLVGVGDPIEHKGQRYPYKLDTIKTFQSDMWDEGFGEGFTLYSELEKIHSLSAA